MVNKPFSYKAIIQIFKYHDLSLLSTPLKLYFLGSRLNEKANYLMSSLLFCMNLNTL